MAAIQERNGSFRVLFRFHGKQQAFTLGKVSRAEAEAKVSHVESLLMRIEQRLIELPPGSDIVAFVENDGAIPVAKDEALVTRDAPTLGSLRDRYLETHGNGTLEAHTLRGTRRHFRHLVRLLGEGFPIRGLSLAELQGDVDRRLKAKGRRGTLLPATVRKEIVTLRTAWNWGVRMKIVTGRFPYDGLRYPKADEKPPFQTWKEIERQLPGLSPAKQKELWESLSLTLAEVEPLLEHVRSQTNHPWIYPLIATAAHTGARKGELLRMRITDADFAASVIIIREKKRAHDRRTTRRVPLSSTLASVLKEWIAVHPGGPYLFAQAEEVSRSKKRSRTTGHLSKDRPPTVAARLSGVKERNRPGILPLTEDEAHHHLARTLRGSQWEIIRGFHVLRHSFISACASRGLDQRFIDEWVGHQSEEQRRRYRHLYSTLAALPVAPGSSWGRFPTSARSARGRWG